jgi:fructokinase
VELIAGIDAGGTSFKCGMFTREGTVVAKRRIPTSTPKETVAACLSFLKDESLAKGHVLLGLGIAAFGPLDLSPTSSSYGAILNTPKKHWSHFPLLGKFQTALGEVPVTIETDVNAALLAELAFGTAQGAISAGYITVGTGIGAGIFVNGGLVGRPSHPEFGHISVKRRADEPNFAGVCPFHGDCLEGLASATALTQRFGDPEKLALDHLAWDLEAYYLAQACLNLSLIGRLEKIVLGGGLLQAAHLLPKIHAHYLDLIHGYLGQSEGDVRDQIVYAGLGDDAGLLGAAHLVKGACFENTF